MSYDKYYENLYQDGKLNNRFVTYLSAIDMENSLLNRDVFKNNPIADICSNYACKGKKFYDAINAPLGFLNDDIQVIYDYALNHIESILKKPNQSIIKEQKLIAKEKVKQLEPKTFNWLANKPGMSIKEKMAYVNKISSPVKRYTYNIKENQVLLAFYKDIARLLNSKISFYEKNADLFGTANEDISRLKSKLNKIKYKLRNEFDEVVEKDYSTPNNALLGNKDYSAIWKSYVELKQTNIDYTNSFGRYVNSFKTLFIALLLNKYDFVEQSLSYDEIDQYILYKIKGGILTEITIRDGFTIVIKEYSLDGVAKETNKNKYVIDFKELETESLSGIPFKLVVNDEEIGEFTADNLGFKLAFDDICKQLSLETDNRTIEEVQKVDLDLISLNSFDNRAYPLNKTITATFHGVFYENKNIYFANSSVVELNDYKNPHFLSYLKLLSKRSNNSNKSTVIYDISDNYDEFSSAELRRNISSVFSKSCPVWRSILLGESLDNKDNVEYVVDMCGSSKSVVVSKLERKNERFIHCGAVEAPIYLQNFNEYDLLSFYLSEYEKEYNVQFPEEVKNSFIKSGALNNVLKKEQENAVLIYGYLEQHEYFVIQFDKNIFIDACLKFIGTAKQIAEYYLATKTIFIVPNFLKEIAAKYDVFVCNEDLRKGSKIISKRLENGDVCWYERLPKLSLEVIKNGMFDSLMLVENKECENIIGRSITIDVHEEFTLTKGEANYILPLNKSFVGDENESFVGKAEDKFFPLDEDVKVKLKLSYCFGAENSYLLKLVPVEKAPFDKIDIKWEKEITNENIINPKIKTTKYDEKTIGYRFNDFQRLSEKLYELRSNNVFHISGFDGYLRSIKYVSNDYGRMVNFSEEMRMKANEVVQNYEVAKNFKFLKKILLSSKKYNEFDLVTIEQAIATFETNTKYFDKKNSKSFKHVENCYGRYLANHYSNDVYELLIEDITHEISQNNYLRRERIHQLISSISDIVACNPFRFNELASENINLSRLVLKSIAKILNDISLVDLNEIGQFKDEYSKKRFINNLGYTIRQSIEILLSFLFLRQRLFFEDLRPNGAIAKEIIYSIKQINKGYYMNYSKFFDENDKKKPRLDTKYSMTFKDIDSNLNNMWNEAYCLILYLSGDERANYIKIGGDE